MNSASKLPARFIWNWNPGAASTARLDVSTAIVPNDVVLLRCLVILRSCHYSAKHCAVKHMAAACQGIGDRSPHEVELTVSQEDYAAEHHTSIPAIADARLTA